MRNIQNLELQAAIVHILDHWTDRKLVLSDTCLSLSGNEAIIEYISAHILNSLHDTVAKAACFHPNDNPAIPSTADTCFAILAGTSDFVKASQELAKKLYSLMEASRAISPGSVIFCLFRDVDSGVQYLGMLKIDLSDGFTPVVSDTNGMRSVMFEVRSDNMPSTREKLQKCAFVRPFSPDAHDTPEYNLMLLDRQVKDTARFFIEFLNAEEAFDARTRTMRLYGCLLDAINIIRGLQGPVIADELRQKANELLLLETVNVPAWIELLPCDSAAKAILESKLASCLPDQEFGLDSTLVATLRQYRRFTGDGGLYIRVLDEEYERMVTVEGGEDGDDEYVITIRTRKWDERRK